VSNQKASVWPKVQIPRVFSTTNPCPVCEGRSVVRINPNSLNLAAATHQCVTCGAKLTSVLNWKSGVLSVVMGTLLMLLSLAAFEFLEQITALPEALRVVFLFAFLGGTFGFFANRVLKSIEFRVWQPRP